MSANEYACFWFWFTLAWANVPHPTLEDAYQTAAKTTRMWKDKVPPLSFVKHKLKMKGTERCA